MTIKRERQELIEKRARFIAYLYCPEKRDEWFNVLSSDTKEHLISVATADVDWFLANLPALASREELREKIIEIIISLRIAMVEYQRGLFTIGPPTSEKVADSILSLLPQEQYEEVKLPENPYLSPRLNDARYADGLCFQGYNQCLLDIQKLSPDGRLYVRKG